MKNCESIRIFINQQPFDFDGKEQTGRSIKERTSIPLCHELLSRRKFDCYDHDAKLSWEKRHIIENNQVVCLRRGQRFWSRESESEFNIKINLQSFLFIGACITGRELKERAGINLADVLFRSRPEEDEVIPNDAEITLSREDCFYSAPPADYGSLDLNTIDVGSEKFRCVPQSDGWTFLIVSNFAVPSGYSLDKAELLIKLPPGFHDASPDMFWVTPHLKTAIGSAPQGTGLESLLGEQWQRFSWHLQPGAWRPGVSTLRDFMRCIYSRFEKNN